MIIPAMRGRDVHGCGYYGASRGKRSHNGVDFVAEPGDLVRCFVGGTITKVGHAYADDLSYRYVEVTLDGGKKTRYFYVDPKVAVGDVVHRGSVVGVAQGLGRRYSGITEHYHFEVFTPRGKERDYRDPLPFLGSL